MVMWSPLKLSRWLWISSAMFQDLPNMGKSTVFFENVLDRVKQQILDILPFKVGNLPVTYLDIDRLLKVYMWCNGDLSRGKAKVKMQMPIEDANMMIMPIKEMEIKQALFDICDNNPSPDEYTAKFYKEAWSTIGKDVCDAVIEFFNKGKMLGEVNATLITLVPKIRRQITDNILTTQELLRGYEWKNGAKRVAMKIDIQKAYDTSLVMVMWSPLKLSRWLWISSAMFQDLPNMGKSTVFFENVLDRVKQQILDILPFKVGNLPVTYLAFEKNLDAIHVTWAKFEKKQGKNTNFQTRDHLRDVVTRSAHKDDFLLCFMMVQVVETTQNPHDSVTSIR
ncbi:hypothetical protein Tco_1515845 [Tanacetum coccineum]